MSWKARIWRLLGKDPEPVVVSFCSGPRELAERMVAEARALVPELRHYAVAPYEIEGVEWLRPEDARRVLRRKRIGLAPTLFAGGDGWKLASRMAPRKVLAYNAALERHHLTLGSWVASLLFLRGVPLDRIWLRPRWWPGRREGSTWPSTHSVIEGRAVSRGRRRVAILSPYCPWPLSHGGAVRIFNLVRECAKEFDVYVLAFAEHGAAELAGSPLLDCCAKVVLFPLPRYREPRWASLDPPEVGEFTCEYVDRVVAEHRQAEGIELLQVEYTQMARYRGEVLVEHDVTFDLYEQIHKGTRTLASWWNLWRWSRFERRAVERFPKSVVMSEKDGRLFGNTVVIPNGVDLAKFRPVRQVVSARVLFVGSFAHFPNVVAFRWFLEHVMPLLGRDVRFVVIAGRNPELYWPEPIPDKRVEFHGFISDVVPFYEMADVVVVPTQVSAGTNLKVIEAMAMERAVVSTTSGVNGLDVVNGQHAWITDDAEGFAGAVDGLIRDLELRSTIAQEGRRLAEEKYGWERIGLRQRALWRELIAGSKGIVIRRGRKDDLPDIRTIQLASHGASQWDAESYFLFDLRVATLRGTLAGFIVSRVVAPGESEVLNLAVSPAARNRGVASALLDEMTEPDVFLEVRESNTVARALYEKQGFRVVGRREDYYDDPVESALVMRRVRHA